MVVYRITNLLNKKTYIGLTIKDRDWYFGSGIAIVNAIKKYGKNNFKKEILETGFKSIEDLCNAEIKWIALERSHNVFGVYNMHDGGSIGDSTRGKTAVERYGKTRAQEMSTKISNTLKIKGIKPPSRKGSKGSEKQRLAVSKSSSERVKSESEIQSLIERTVRPIICIETGIEYPSLKTAAESLNLSKGNICSVLKGNRKSTKGFTFKYLEKK